VTYKKISKNLEWTVNPATYKPYNLYVEAVNNVHYMMCQHPKYMVWKKQRELENDYDE